MELEKEIRFLVNDETWDIALKLTTPYKDKVKMLDLTFGLYGKESVAKTGKVFRIRQKPDKVTMEIKNRIEGGWEEESITLDSVTRGISFFTLAGLKPYLFIDRFREIKKFKNLKIFFDDIKYLGKYIEIEYQDCEDSQDEIEEFCKVCNIDSEPQPLYGEIINQKYDNDDEFRSDFDKYLDEILSNIN